MIKKILMLFLTLYVSSIIPLFKREELMKQFYNGMPVLVTGGAGFIGSHLVEKLVNLGAHVTVMDNLSTGNLQNLNNVLDKITFLKADITNFEQCLEATRYKKIVFHLAAFISVPNSMQNPYQCHEVNVNGIFNMLEACRMNEVERFVFSSSAAVYGSKYSICHESLLPNPESPYGTSKLIGEFYCKQYAQNFNLSSICLRYFNVFGERQNPNGHYAAVVAKFRHQMRNNLPITIFGDGLQTRDFIPVTQVVDANLTLGMLKPENMNGEIYNIATGKSITLLELIDLLKEEFPDYCQQLSFNPARPGDIKYSQAQCSKYKQIIEEFGN